MKTKDDADKALEMLDASGATGLERDSVARFLTEVKDQLPDAEKTDEQRRQDVADAARRGYSGT